MDDADTIPENEDEEEDSKAVLNKQPTAGAAIDDEEEDFSLKFPKEYHSKTHPNQKVVE